jgi:hypothetical protein
MMIYRLRVLLLLRVWRRKAASCLLPCAGYPKLRGAVLLRSGGKKSTISGNNGALEHPYLP